MLLLNRIGCLVIRWVMGLCNDCINYAFLNKGFSAGYSALNARSRPFLCVTYVSTDLSGELASSISCCSSRGSLSVLVFFFQYSSHSRENASGSLARSSFATCLHSLIFS